MCYLEIQLELFCGLMKPKLNFFARTIWWKSVKLRNTMEKHCCTGAVGKIMNSTQHQGIIANNLDTSIGRSFNKVFMYLCTLICTFKSQTCSQWFSMSISVYWFRPTWKPEWRTVHSLQAKEYKWANKWAPILILITGRDLVVLFTPWETSSYMLPKENNEN